MGPDFGSSVSYKDYEEEESADGEQSEDLFAGMPADDVETQPGSPPQLAPPPADASEAPAVRAELPQAPEVPKAPEVSKAPGVRFLPVPQAPSPSAATSPEARGSKAPPAVRFLPVPQGLALAPPPAPRASDRARNSLGASSKGSASHCPPRALLPPPVRFAGVSVDDLFTPIDISKYRGAPKPVAVSEASRNLAQAIAKFSTFKAPSSITAQA